MALIPKNSPVSSEPALSEAEGSPAVQVFAGCNPHSLQCVPPCPAKVIALGH
jgi:hypothetical protein